MNNIKVIIFDYDGVIAESVHVKTEAFAELYMPFGNKVVNSVVKHHEANGGMSRFEKFKIYHKDFLKQDLTESDIDKLSQKFTDLVLQKVIDSPFVRGAFEFISNNYTYYDFFISTATPTEEIESILLSQDIRKYFLEVYGSPEKKDIHISKILQKHNYKNDEVVFIGDTPSDRDAAVKNKIHFIGRYTTSEEIKKEKHLIENFGQIDNIIKNES